jgi:hypothetical protein
MSNGNFAFRLAAQWSDDIQMMKNRVTTAGETALLGARPETFWPEGMFEIARAVQKMTGNCL